jgi:hypothetical protein
VLHAGHPSNGNPRNTRTEWGPRTADGDPRHVSHARHALSLSINAERELGLRIHLAQIIAHPTRIQAGGNKPKLDEFAVVLKAMLRLQHKDGSGEVRAGQAFIGHAEEWVRYWTAEAGCPDIRT